MDIQVLSQLIGNFGFPIVCCGALFWQQNKVMKEMSVTIEGAIKSLESGIDKNTVATTSLVATVETLAKVGD